MAIHVESFWDLFRVMINGFLDIVINLNGLNKISSTKWLNLNSHGCHPWLLESISENSEGGQCYYVPLYRRVGFIPIEKCNILVYL